MSTLHFSVDRNLSTERISTGSGGRAPQSQSNSSRQKAVLVLFIVGSDLDEGSAV